MKIVMKMKKVKFKVEDNGFFYQYVEYTDNLELAIKEYIKKFNGVYGDIKGLRIESYEIM